MGRVEPGDNHLAEIGELPFFLEGWGQELGQSWGFGGVGEGNGVHLKGEVAGLAVELTAHKEEGEGVIGRGFGGGEEG